MAANINEGIFNPTSYKHISSTLCVLLKKLTFTSSLLCSVSNSLIGSSVIIGKLRQFTALVHLVLLESKVQLRQWRE